MTYQRTACTYLVVEDRRPTRYEINGNCVISGSYDGPRMTGVRTTYTFTAETDDHDLVHYVTVTDPT